MKIYGVAFLAACYLIGQILGDALGLLFSFNGNIGGVGFGMLLLIILGDEINKRGWMDNESESGILFWSGLYIPVVVAMSSIQNVKAALTGGWTAVIIGVVATMCCFALIPVVSSLAKRLKN
jgi:malonate transporter MadL subunit